MKPMAFYNFLSTAYIHGVIFKGVFKINHKGNRIQQVNSMKRSIGASSTTYPQSHCSALVAQKDHRKMEVTFELGNNRMSPL